MSVEKLQPRLRYIPATVFRMVKELRLRNQPRAGWGCLYYWGRIGIGAQLSASRASGPKVGWALHFCPVEAAQRAVGTRSTRCHG